MKITQKRILFSILCVSLLSATGVFLSGAPLNTTDPQSDSSAPQSQAVTVLANYTFNGNWADAGPSIVPYGSASLSSSNGVDFGGYLDVSGIGTYAVIPAEPSMASTPMTVEFWMKSTADYGASQEIMRKSTDEGYQFRLFRYLWDQYNDGDVILRANDVMGLSYQASNGNDLSHGEWHHVVVLLQEFSIGYYIDTDWIHSTGVSNGLSVNTSEIIIGDSAQSADLYIDNLVIYNGILSEGEIQSRYAQYYPLAEPTVSNEYPAVGEEVTFNANAWGGTPPYLYTWNFGDGYSSYTSTAYHTYYSSGSYQVSLNVQDNNGNSYFDTFWVYPTQSDDGYEDNDDYLSASTVNPYSESFLWDLKLMDEDYYNLVNVNAYDRLVVTLSTWGNMNDIRLSEIDGSTGGTLQYETGGTNNELTLTIEPLSFSHNSLIRVDYSSYGIIYNLSFYTEYAGNTADDNYEENDIMSNPTYLTIPFSEQNLKQYDDDWYSIPISADPVYMRFNRDTTQNVYFEVYNTMGYSIETFRFDQSQSEMNIERNWSNQGSVLIVARGDSVGAWYGIEMSYNKIQVEDGTNTDGTADGSDTSKGDTSSLPGLPTIPGYDPFLFLFGIGIAGLILRKKH